uniref:Acyltransferase family protein n=1 Tax=Roseihalotalea indica TaxID=2867963 RepID=A0AA49JJT4_9BACT|nr:acyltransferase family protein [Tunicatimonas sp. TK19036]
MLTTNRRYDIDWLRVIAIGLLLVYHIAIGFQLWGVMIGFIANKNPWPSLWIPMMMLNVWRIPLLFFVSGMGVYFALRRRNWKQLITERANRILVPFLFGIFFIVPLHIFIWQNYYNMDLSYNYNPGHLWFLGNIFVYVVVLSPVFFYLKNNEEGVLAQGIKKILSTPLGLIPVIAAFMMEVVLVNPTPYELYAMTWHGFFLGLLAFFFGFCFVLSGPPFWEMMLKWRWLFLVVAAALFAVRLTQYPQPASNYLVSVESNAWILAVFAFGYRYLNHPSAALSYLSQAAYPVYIVHMVFLYLGSWLIFPLNIPAPLQFGLLVVFTVAGCFGMYELIIRRVNFIRPLFGLKKKALKARKLSFSS